MTWVTNRLVSIGSEAAPEGLPGRSVKKQQASPSTSQPHEGPALKGPGFQASGGVFSLQETNCSFFVGLCLGAAGSLGQLPKFGGVRNTPGLPRLHPFNVS